MRDATTALPISPMPRTELLAIRHAAARWQIVDRLVKRLTMIVRANAGIDAVTERGWHGHALLRTAAGSEKELTALQTDIAHEINQLTAEVLRAELKEQKRKDAK